MKAKKALRLLQKILTSPRAFAVYLGHCLKQYRYNDLIRFAIEEVTDKGVLGHNYVRVYDFFMRSHRGSIEYVCEVGLLRHVAQRSSTQQVHPDAPSLRMWRKYLPNAHLVGFDVKEFEHPHDKNCTIIQGDQSSREDLQKIVDHHSGYDVIIDDARHASPHQQITLSFLFPHVRSGGIYFIEDLNTQRAEFERDDVPKTIELLKKLQTTGVWSSPLSTPEEKKALETQVKEIHFFESLKGPNLIVDADALAAIVKK